MQKKYHLKCKTVLTGSKKEGNYTGYFKSKGANSVGVWVDLIIKFNYPEKYKLIKDSDSSISDQDLDILLENRAELLWVRVEGLYVGPKRRGIGKFIVSEMITALKQHVPIKGIVLHPRDIDAEKFWTKMGFNEYRGQQLKIDGELMDFRSLNEMIYEL